MNKKDMDKYTKEYGDIPSDFSERFNLLLNTLKLDNKTLTLLKEKTKKLLKHKWEKQKYVIYMFPKATPRSRFSGRTKKFYVKDARTNNDSFKDFCKENSINELITTPCHLVIDNYMPMPKMNKVDTILAELKLIRPIPKPDWDNLGKTYSDMIQNNVLLDDCLIIDGRSRKFYSLKPRIEVSLKYMTKYDCIYNKRKVESWGTYSKNKDRVTEKETL